MLTGEKLLWWELDKIATKEAGVGMNTDKSNAAENMMRFLEQPNYNECQSQYLIDSFK